MNTSLMNVRMFGFLLSVAVWLTGCGYPADWDEARRTCEPFREKAGSRVEFYEYNRVIDDPKTPDLKTSAWPSSLPFKQAGFLQFEQSLTRIPDVTALLLSYQSSLLYEKYYNGLSATKSQNVHSLSKSILSMVVGIMLQRKELDSLSTPLRSVLPPNYQSYLQGDRAKITVGDLLKMLSGLSWVEDETEEIVDQRSQDWIAEILQLSMSDYDHRKFTYSTGNTHIMSSVVQQLTGANLCEYTHRHLFLPLGLKAEHWGVDPKGYLSGGFEVNLTAREIAVLGHLMVNDNPDTGYPRFFSKEWVSMATTKQATDTSQRSYGYLWWIAEGLKTPVYFAWGYGGQFLFVIPAHSLSMVITTTTVNDETRDDAILTAVMSALKQWL